MNSFDKKNNITNCFAFLCYFFIDLEAHGGLYTLHSHLNHSCTPNVSARHFDQRSSLSRLTLIAKSPIKKGEELCISYVNPESGVRWRQRELEPWGFGRCRCARCEREEREEKEREEKEKAEGGDGEEKEKKADGEGKDSAVVGDGGGGGGEDLDGLEEELKAGLGVR
jgi:hypothetical protein